MSDSHGSSASHPPPQPSPGPSQSVASAVNLETTSSTAERDDLHHHPSPSSSSRKKKSHDASAEPGSDLQSATTSTPKVVTSLAGGKSCATSGGHDLGQRTRDSSSSDAHTPHPSSSSPLSSSSSSPSPPPVTSSSSERAYAQQSPKDESSEVIFAEGKARPSEPARKVIGSCAQGGKSSLLSSLSSSPSPSSPLAAITTERLLKSGVELGARSKSQTNSKKGVMVSSSDVRTTSDHKVKEPTSPGANGAHPEQSGPRAAARNRKREMITERASSPSRGGRTDQEKTKSSPTGEQKGLNVQISAIETGISPADNQSRPNEAPSGGNVTEVVDPSHVRLVAAKVSSPDDVTRAETVPKSQNKNLEHRDESPDASRMPSSGKGLVTSPDTSKLSNKPLVPPAVQSKNSTTSGGSVDKQATANSSSKEQGKIAKNGTPRGPSKSQSTAAKDAAIPTHFSDAPAGSGGEHPHHQRDDGDRVTTAVVIAKGNCNGHVATPTKHQVQSPRVGQIIASATKTSGKGSKLDSSSSSSSSCQSLSTDRAQIKLQRLNEDKAQQASETDDSPQQVAGVNLTSPIQLSPATSKAQSPGTKRVSIREPEMTTTGKSKELVVQSSQKPASSKKDISPTPSARDSESAGPSHQQSSSLGDAESESTGTWVEDGRGGTVSKGEINGMANPRNSKSCCFCWCCCCSCSCLSVNNNIRREKDKKMKEKQLGSSDNFFNGNGETPPTLEDIRTWGESFEKLMKCGAGRKVFREFLKCEYSEENILFWQACEDLKKETNPEATEEKARVIYEDFISILSPREVSLDSAVREVINKNMVCPTTQTFDEAQLQIYTLMHRDSYPRFVNSPLYRQLAQLPVPSRKGSMV